MKNLFSFCSAVLAASLLAGCDTGCHKYYQFCPNEDASMAEVSMDVPDCMGKQLYDNGSECWAAPMAARTGIMPMSGKYLASASGMKIPNDYSIQSKEFLVEYKLASTEPVLMFSVNGWRIETLYLRDGAFGGSFGGRRNGSNVDCPSDGYAISGSFTSTASAQGVFYYIRYCTVVSVESYIAAIVSLPDSSIDATAADTDTIDR